MKSESFRIRTVEQNKTFCGQSDAFYTVNYITRNGKIHISKIRRIIPKTNLIKHFHKSLLKEVLSKFINKDDSEIFDHISIDRVEIVE